MQHLISDNELISLYLSGNEQGLGELVHRHKTRIFTSIYVLVKDEELANDIFQDTFIKVINTLRSGNYHEEGKFLPWVLRIAHNLVIDHFRRSKRMPMLHDTDEDSVFRTMKSDEYNIEEVLVTKQIHKDVRMLINKLPDEQRDVVMMRHYANLSFKEIADAMDCSVNTALGRMRYALLNMRKLMDENKISLQR
ncbi:MAG: sigma-70 family RNA polymerase sigma factor [Bacteroidia bacterium]|nr:sigma-70 family RNA polymerase sigma factor [Bacteroidia bacterium]HQV00909.1 sigma-70 family RNA polymerase sigma factor [Bacteroidia bacterium]